MLGEGPRAAVVRAAEQGFSRTKGAENRAWEGRAFGLGCPGDCLNSLPQLVFAETSATTGPPSGEWTLFL